MLHVHPGDTCVFELGLELWAELWRYCDDEEY